MINASILIVEDEAVVALDLKLQLQELGYVVAGIAASGEQAIDAAAALAPQLILMDVRLQGKIDGIAAAESIRRSHEIPLIFLTSHSDADTVQRAARTAPYGYLTKPFQIKELRAGIEVALTKARMERQLREADRWFAHTLQCVGDGVLVTDSEGKVRFLNPAAEQLTGWWVEDAVGKPVGDIVRLSSPKGPAPQRRDTAQEVRNVLRDGRPTPVAHALSLLSRDGAEKLVDETIGPVDDDGGQRLGAVLVLRDAAQRVEQESRLRASEARFRSTFDFAPLGMALVSFAGEFMLVNDAMCALLGLTRDDLRHLNQSTLTWEPDREHESLRLHELDVSAAGVVQFEKRYHRPSGGEPIWTLVSVSLIHDADQPSCYLYQVNDLTQQKKAAEHLAALVEERMRREATEMVIASKTQFLSRVSHEMRTPLNAVIGFAQLLQIQQVTADPANVGKYAGHIHAAGTHLLGLVTDLIDLDRSAEGTLKLESAPVALASVVEEALRLLRDEATAHGVELDARVDELLTVMADPRRLRQVVLNVVSNAIKYNRQGGEVQIRAQRLPEAGVSLTIQDHGIGMTREQTDRLFQPFERLGAENTTVSGTGLGLVISRGLVTEMGGNLSIESESRSGTRVTITLRAAL